MTAEARRASDRVTAMTLAAYTSLIASAVTDI